MTINGEQFADQADNELSAQAPLARLLVKTSNGDTRALAGEIGLSVMEIIRGAGIDELPALCGGCCSCATCHVHVEPSWFDRLPAMSDDEIALLGDTPDKNELSRLSCQIPFTRSLDGLEIAIARIETD